VRVGVLRRSSRGLRQATWVGMTPEPEAMSVSPGRVPNLEVWNAGAPQGA